jgi:hypothetical protein
MLQRLGKYIYNACAFAFIVVLYVFYICTHLSLPKARDKVSHPKRVPKHIAPLTEHEAHVLRRIAPKAKMEAAAFYRDYLRGILTPRQYVLYQFGQPCFVSETQEQLYLLGERHDEPFYVGYVGETPFIEIESEL